MQGRADQAQPETQSEGPPVLPGRQVVRLGDVAREVLEELPADVALDLITLFGETAALAEADYQG